MSERESDKEGREKGAVGYERLTAGDNVGMDDNILGRDEDRKSKELSPKVSEKFSNIFSSSDSEIEFEKKSVAPYDLRSRKRRDTGTQKSRTGIQGSKIEARKVYTSSPTEESDSESKREHVSPRESGASVVLDMFNEAERVLAKKLKEVTKTTEEQQVALRHEQDKCNELASLRNSIQYENKMIEEETQELEMKQRDLRKRYESLTHNVLRLTQDVQMKGVECQNKRALLQQVNDLVKEIRLDCDKVENERLRSLSMIDECNAELGGLVAAKQRKDEEKQALEFELGKACKEKEKMGTQLDEYIQSINDIMEKRKEYEKQEEESARLWEEKLQAQSKVRFQEFRTKERALREERMCALEREEKELDEEIVKREQRVQAKRERVLELKSTESVGYDSKLKGATLSGDTETISSNESELAIEMKGKNKDRSKRGSKNKESSPTSVKSRESKVFSSQKVRKERQNFPNLAKQNIEIKSEALESSESSSELSSESESEVEIKPRHSRGDSKGSTHKCATKGEKAKLRKKGKDRSHGTKTGGHGVSKIVKRGHRKPRSQVSTSLSNSSESESETNGKSKSSQMKPQKFNGTDVFSDFLSQFEACKEYNRWTEREAAFQLYSCCHGDALNRLATDGVTPKTSSYSDLVEVLEREFGPRECKSSYILELNQVKQNPGESVRELGNRVKKLASLAFRGKDMGSKRMREEMSLNSFTLALRRKDIRDTVFGAEFKTLKQAIDKAEYLESYHKRDDEVGRDIPEKKRDKHVSFSRKLVTEERVPDIFESDDDWGDRLVSKFLYQLDQRQRQCESSLISPDGKSNMHARTLINAAQDSKPSQMSTTMTKSGGRSPWIQDGPPLVCYECGEAGHIRRNCPQRTHRYRVRKPFERGYCLNCLQHGHEWRECGYPPLCFTCHGEGHLSRDCSVNMMRGTEWRPGNEWRPNRRPQARPQSVGGHENQSQSQSMNQSQIPQ